MFNDKCEVTRSTTFGVFSENGIWKRFARKHFGLRSLVQKKFSSQSYVRTLGLNIVYQPRCWKKIRPDEDDGYEQLVPFCREHTLSRANPQSRVSAAIPGRTVIGPVIEVQNREILEQPGLDMSIPSPHTHEQTTHVLITRGTNRFVDEVHDHKVQLRPSTEFLSTLQKSEGRESFVEESINNNKETCALHVTSRHGNKEACVNNLSSPPSCSSLFKKTFIPTSERKWVDIPGSSSFGDALPIAVSKMVTRMVRHYDKEERERDGSYHWDTVRPLLLKGIGKQRAQHFSEKYWIQLIQEKRSEKILCGSQKFLGLTSSNSRTLWWYSVNAGTDGIHFHRGCSWNVQSKLGSGLIPGGKESDKARQAVFFTPLNPSWWKSKRRTQWYYDVPQKVHYHSHWKRNQDAGCWIKLAKHKIWDSFWQTKSFTIITRNPQSCAKRLHLQSTLWERRTSTVRKTLNPKASIKSYAEKQLACAAAAAYSQWIRDGTRDVRGYTTLTGNSSGKPVQDPEPKIE